MYFKLNYFITVFIRAIFLKTILAQNESSLGEIRLIFLILYEILSDNLVSVNFFGPHFDPLGMGSKLMDDDLADFTKTDLKTFFLNYSPGIDILK
jgi:hypothetical protein